MLFFFVSQSAKTNDTVKDQKQVSCYSWKIILWSQDIQVEASLNWCKSCALSAVAQAGNPGFDAVAQSWDDGPYMFILKIEDKNQQSSAKNPWNLKRQCTRIHKTQTQTAVCISLRIS